MDSHFRGNDIRSNEMRLPRFLRKLAMTEELKLTIFTYK
jgi:hypothetical protein